MTDSFITGLSPDDSLIAIYGPTASGKSELALQVSEKIGGEIVNYDSVQLYKHFNIGSAKPSASDLRKVKHHLIDVVDAGQEMDAAIYRSLSKGVHQNLVASKTPAVFVGGTGLYLRAFLGHKWHELPSSQELREQLEILETPKAYELLANEDPQRAKELKPQDRFRILRALEIVRLTGKTFSDLTSNTEKPLKVKILLRNPDKDLLLKRIEARTKAMLSMGLIEEVKQLLSNGCPPDCLPMRSIGYQQAVRHLQRGDLPSREVLTEEIVIATRQYAKRQRTWINEIKDDFNIIQVD